MSVEPPLAPLQQTFVELEAGSEWRFELEADENVAVRVSGTCMVDQLFPWSWSVEESVEMSQCGVRGINRNSVCEVFRCLRLTQLTLCFLSVRSLFILKLAHLDLDVLGHSRIEYNQIRWIASPPAVFRPRTCSSPTVDYLHATFPLWRMGRKPKSGCSRRGVAWCAVLSPASPSQEALADDSYDLVVALRHADARTHDSTSPPPCSRLVVSSSSVICLRAMCRIIDLFD